jgi:hypothetical protein
MVAQRWLDTKLISGRTQDGRTAGVARMAVAYNENRKDKTRADRINELHGLQVAMLKWLDQFESPDQNVSDVALWVKELLNEVQREHLELITASVDKQDADPPVANFAKLSEKEKVVVKAIWSQLVAGTGNIRITETEMYTDTSTSQASSRPHVGFRYEALAQFARLLETSTGRAIVSQVNADTKGQKLVTIKPGFAEPSQGAPGSEFAAGPDDLSGKDKLTPVDTEAMFKGKPNAKKRREAYRRKFVEVDMSKIADPKLKAAEIYKARNENPQALGLRIGGKYYKFGEGTSVSVTMTWDIRDAEEHHTSRFVDENLNEIPTPNFITLGHELGHAAHMQKGVALGHQDTNDQLFPLIAPQASEKDWSNFEEYANINSVENALRSEFGLKSRYGHINQASVQKSRLEPIANDFYSLSDLQPQPLRGAVEAPLGQAGLSLAKLEIPPARTSLVSAATTFLGQMDTAFPAFTPGEKGAVRGELNQFKTKVKSAEAGVLAAARGHVNQANNLVTQARNRVQQAGQQQVNQGGSFWGSLWPF